MQEDKIKEAFSKVKEDIDSLKDVLSSLTTEVSKIKRTIQETDRQTIPQTDNNIISTDRQISSTNNLQIGSKVPNSMFSTGNEGVQTDRQTIPQTDRHSIKFAQDDKITHIKKVAEIVSSLDSLKKELRSQFKKLTSQEMFIFSTLYQLTDEDLSVDYKLLADRTSLSESSIRDYIQKIMKKGIPIEKNKQDNKKVMLSIPSDFKRMASLSTIISLRDL